MDEQRPDTGEVTDNPPESTEPQSGEQSTAQYPTAPYPQYAQYPPQYGVAPNAGAYPTAQYPQYQPYPQYAPYPPQGGQPYQPTDYATAYPAAGYATSGYWSPPPPAAPTVSSGGASPSRKRRRILITSGVAALIAAACVTGLVTTGNSLSVRGTGTTSAIIPNQSNGSTGSGGSTSGGLPGSTGSNGSGSNGTGSNGTGSTGTGSTSTGTATTAQQIGIVDITTELKYQQAEAAGTGMVLTSNGEILTNNHVVEGATSINVTVVSTGKTYTATVVGTDPTEDIAVLQLSNASGLATAKISTTATVAVGDAVTAVGNAEGKGGTPSSASGQVTALNQSITASDDNGSNAENLTGLIESNAPIEPGDSGGPLYNASGEIVGIDTAGSSSTGVSRGYSASTLTQAYSIPITTAVSIAKQIEAGQASSTIHIGNPAFIGVSIAAATNTSGGFGGSSGTGTGAGAVVSGVVDGAPAAAAGLVAGDTITAVGSTTVTSQTDLAAALAQYKPGQTVKITWTDASGQSHSASLKLIAGPAD